MPVYAVPGATNLLHNPDFEVNNATYQYWELINATHALNTERFSGTYSWRLLAVLTGGIGLLSPNTFSDPKRVLATAGLPYSFAIRVKTEPGITNKNLVLELVFKDAAGVTLASNASETFIVSDDRWYEGKIENVIAPVGTDYVVTYATITSIPSASGAFFEAADLRQSATIDSFVAGTQGAPKYGWSGTAHQSTSYRNAEIVNFNVGRRGLIKITAEMFLSDKLNNLGEDITHLIKSGSVSMRTSRAIKMEFKGELTAPTEIEAFTDYVAPYLTIERFDADTITSQVGLYSTAPMVETITPSTRIGAIDAKDLLWNLSESSFQGYYSIPAGRNYVEEVIKILLSEGFTRYSIIPSTKVLPLNRTWKAEDSKLTIINDLLNSIGYYTLFANNYGIFTSFPFRDLFITEPATFLYSGQGSEVIGSIKKEPLINSIYNYVKVIKEDSQSSANSFVYELKNENILSPTSIQNLGRTKFLAINDTQIESLEVARARALKIIQEASSLYTNYTVQTLPDPTRSCWEIYDTNILMSDGSEALVGPARCDGWDLGFTPSTAVMSHFVNRLEPM